MCIVQKEVMAFSPGQNYTFLNKCQNFHVSQFCLLISYLRQTRLLLSS